MPIANKLTMKQTMDAGRRATQIEGDAHNQMRKAQTLEDAMELYRDIKKRAPAGVAGMMSSDDEMRAHWAPRFVNKKHSVVEGNNLNATSHSIGAHAVALDARSNATATGDKSHAVALGPSGKATNEGDRGTATGETAITHGAWGVAHGRDLARSSGDESHAITHGDGGFAETTGKRGIAVATGDTGKASATGEHGVGAVLQSGGRARAGVNGSMVLSHHDENGRLRHVVGYAGENGIEPHKWYRLNDQHQFELHPDQENGDD